MFHALLNREEVFFLTSPYPLKFANTPPAHSAYVNLISAIKAVRVL